MNSLPDADRVALGDTFTAEGTPWMHQRDLPYGRYRNGYPSHPDGPVILRGSRYRMDRDVYGRSLSGHNAAEFARRAIRKLRVTAFGEEDIAPLERIMDYIDNRWPHQKTVLLSNLVPWGGGWRGCYIDGEFIEFTIDQESAIDLIRKTVDDLDRRILFDYGYRSRRQIKGGYTYQRKGAL